MIIVDTNVVSELMRPRPAEPVANWLEAKAGEALTLTAITVAEILFGTARLPRGARKNALVAAATDVFSTFGTDGVLPFDGTAARIYAEIKAQRADAGRPISVLDAQIAAICRTHRATLATRNVRDFEDLELDLVNPWR